MRATRENAGRAYLASRRRGWVEQMADLERMGYVVIVRAGCVHAHFSADPQRR